MRVKLTEKLCREAKAPEGKGELTLFDSEQTGLHLRVYAGGSRGRRAVFWLQYRARGQRRTLKIKLGPYGTALTLDAARRLARQTLGRVWAGEDPAADLRGEREAARVTLDAFSKTYLARHADPFKKSADADRWMLDKHILPVLGRLPVAGVEVADVARFLAGYVDRPVLANRLRALLAVMFRLAEEWGERPEGSNPTRHTRRHREQHRERFLSPAELVKLGEVMAAALQSGAERPEVIAAVKLLLFTGCRRGEIELLTWPEVDLAGRCIRLADSKTGARGVPLNSAALEVLAGVPRQHESWVFLHTRASKPGPIGLTAAWERLRRAADLEDVHLHDLRHSHASVGVASGLSLLVLAKLLGHSGTAMTERYAHVADDPVRAASEAIGNRIAAALGGREAAPVVELHAHAETA